MLAEALRRSPTSTPTACSATTNVGEHVPSPCYALLQIKSGKFVRVFPTKKGTLDCNPKNLYTIKLDLS